MSFIEYLSLSHFAIVSLSKTFKLLPLLFHIPLFVIVFCMISFSICSIFFTLLHSISIVCVICKLGNLLCSCRRWFIIRLCLFMHSHFGISFLYLFNFCCILILILYVLCICYVVICDLCFFRSSIMWSLKTILLELFLQAHDMIVLGYKANELNIMFNFPMYQII